LPGAPVEAPAAPSNVAPAAEGSAPPPAAAKRAGARNDSTADDATAEARLLGQARAELARDPARALDLTREHRRRFASGALAQEREVIAIEALGRLGRRADAERRAREFGAKYPDSAHNKKVGASLGDR
jgi:hypothetical protein